MKLQSSAFEPGQTIPRRFTCDGDDLSPPLEWSGAPAETRSFVILCQDPDAPRGTWHHWAAYDIPAGRTALEAGGNDFKQAMNDFHRRGYGGPCPPQGHGPHHYHFSLLALSVDHLPVPESSNCREVEHEARMHLIAEARLTGMYGR